MQYAGAENGQSTRPSTGTVREHACARCARGHTLREQSERQKETTQAENDRLRAENARKEQRTNALADLVKDLAQIVFGRKSERMVGEAASIRDEASNADNGMTADKAASGVAPTDGPGAPATTGMDPPAADIGGTLPGSPRPAPRRWLSPDLPTEEIILEPEGDLSSYRCIGEEVIRKMVWVRGCVAVRIYRRRKYVHIKTGKIIIAKRPPSVIDKGMADASLLAQIVTGKYQHGLPLHRQREIFRSAGASFARSTMSDWVIQSGKALMPLNDAHVAAVLKSGNVQADETTIKVQNPQKKGKLDLCFFWVFHAPEAKLTAVQFRPGRDRKGLLEFLGNYQGAIQSDGYAVYDVLEKIPGITHYGCWAHARRYFVKIL